MQKIEKLCDAILIHARSKSDTSAPKVTFAFNHNGTDIPDVFDSWHLRVTLISVEMPITEPHEGDPDVPKERVDATWEAKGESPEKAFIAVAKQVQGLFKARGRQIHGEQAALDLAVQTLKADTDLASIWDTPEDEASRALGQMAAESEALRAQAEAEGTPPQ
jgi:hypothetical protein